MGTTTDSSTVETEPQLSDTDESAAEDEASQAESLSLNVVYDILKNTRRRRVLHLLEEAEDETATLGDLAERIAAIENDKPRAQLNAQERKRVYVGLYQCHLPRMDDAGVIDFDDNRGTVELGTYAPQVYEQLNAATDSEEVPQWPRYYAAYGVGSLLLATVLAVGAPPLVQTAGIVVLLAGLIGLAVLHARLE